MKSFLRLRRMQPDQDAPRILAIYRAAIDALDDRAYDREQRAVWSGWAAKDNRLTRLLQKGTTIVAICDGAIAGFAQLYPDDQINMLYVHPDFGRQGIGSHLLAALEAIAIRKNRTQLTTRASRASRALFRRSGFQLQGEENVVREGIELQGFRMTKALPAKEPAQTP